MNAHDVIESYVRDVASCLPRSKRNDVAFELRALLAEELAAKAQESGREPDKAMAMELLKGFGRPSEAAERYHQRPAVIASSDTHHFLIWSMAGVIALSVLSGISATGSVDGSHVLQWLGVLVVAFAVRGWLRRKNPHAMGWKPRPGQDVLPRWAAALCMVALLVFPTWMYAMPQTFTEVAFVGFIPTDGLELTEAFRHSWQRWLTLSLLCMAAASYGVVLIQGRWYSQTRWFSVAAFMLLGMMLVAHAAPMAVLPGREPFMVFASEMANTVASPIFALVGAMLVLCTLYEAYREWSRIRPAPAEAVGSKT